MAFTTQQGRTATSLSEINVTPLVDVMLVLLIVFMVTAPMMQQGMSVDLPEDGSPALNVTQDAKSFFITVAANGTIMVDDKTVDEETLRQAVGKAKGENPTTQFYLRSDKNVPYGRVVKIMSILTKLGVTNLNVVTTAEKSGSS